MCDATQDVCETQEFIATRFICVDGVWQWAERELHVLGTVFDTFCPQWRHCVWNEGNASLWCDGLEATALNSTTRRLPANLDPRLEHVVLVNHGFPRVGEEALSNLPAVRHLNLSSNGIFRVEDMTLTFPPNLDELDLSFNNLPPSLPFIHLPARNRLRLLDLRGVAGESRLLPANLAVVSAMATCGLNEAPVLLTDNNTCSIAAVSGADGERCWRTTCAQQEEHTVPCPGNAPNKATSQVLQRQLCDSIPDCPDGSDEAADYCAWAVTYLGVIDKDPDCVTLEACFAPVIEVTVHSGVTVLSQFQDEDVGANCPFSYSLAFHVVALAPDNTSMPQRLRFLSSILEPSLTFDFEPTLTTVSGPTQFALTMNLTFATTKSTTRCVFAFERRLDESAETATRMLNDSTTVAIAVAAAVGVIVLFLAVVFVLLRRKQVLAQSHTISAQVRIGTGCKCVV